MPTEGSKQLVLWEEQEKHPYPADIQALKAEVTFQKPTAQLCTAQQNTSICRGPTLTNNTRCPLSFASAVISLSNFTFFVPFLIS